MKNILALIGLVVVLVIGLGWYLGWFQVQSQPSSDGHRNFNVDVNTKKIIEDEQNAQKKISGAINNSGSNNDSKGTTTIVPSVPTEKKVEAQPVSGTGGLKINDDGSFTIIPPYKNVGQ